MVTFAPVKIVRTVPRPLPLRVGFVPVPARVRVWAIVALPAIKLSVDRRVFDWEQSLFYWADTRDDAGVLDFSASALVHPQRP